MIRTASQEQIVLTSPVDSEGIVRCYKHSIPAIRRTSHTSKNPNRDFFVCAALPQCNFFVWVDEIPDFHDSEKDDDDMAGVMGSQDSQISSSSQVPPSTPRKRGASPSFTTPARKLARGNNGTIPRNNFNTPEDKRKRLEEIERALAEKSGNRSDAHHERDVSVPLPVTPTKGPPTQLKNLQTPSRGPQAPPMLLATNKGKGRELQPASSQESLAGEDVFGPSAQNSMSTPHPGPSRRGQGLRQSASASSLRSFTGSQAPELSPEEVSDLLDKLSGIPAQLRKRRALADKREESAKKRIEELEEENADLVMKVESLEYENERLLARIRELEGE
ncbi:hypothetical protein K523DRAFT_142023, partial [Schizophyllum commune Tattone D]